MAASPRVAAPVDVERVDQPSGLRGCDHLTVANLGQPFTFEPGFEFGWREAPLHAVPPDSPRAQSGCRTRADPATNPIDICERMFVTSEGRPGARLQRALAARNLTAAEQAAFEIAFISLAQARELVELYAEKGDPKYERAALKYLTRYMAEGSPSLADVAQVAAVLAERGLLMCGL